MIARLDQLTRNIDKVIDRPTTNIFITTKVGWLATSVFATIAQ